MHVSVNNIDLRRFSRRKRGGYAGYVHRDWSQSFCLFHAHFDGGRGIKVGYSSFSLPSYSQVTNFRPTMKITCLIVVLVLALDCPHVEAAGDCVVKDEK